jgi:hypothetical protein
MKKVHSNQEDKKYQFYSSLYVNDNGVLISSEIKEKAKN